MVCVAVCVWLCVWLCVCMCDVLPRPMSLVLGVWSTLVTYVLSNLLLQLLVDLPLTAAHSNTNTEETTFAAPSGTAQARGSVVHHAAYLLVHLGGQPFVFRSLDTQTYVDKENTPHSGRTHVSRQARRLCCRRETMG